MKLFGRKSAGRGFLRPGKMRAPLAGGIATGGYVAGANGVRLFGSALPAMWPQNYEAQLREGYLHNAVAQRAVRLVTENVAAAPVAASNEKALTLIRQHVCGQALLEAVAAHLLLHGNAYIGIVNDAAGKPCELYALRPERVSVELDAMGWPAGYAYRIGAEVTRLPMAQVVHIRTLHPGDDHYGLGCLGAASGAIAVHNVAARWNKALLDNGARPSGALVYESGESTLSQEQFARLRDELEASFAGSGNAGRPMLLEGGLRWQPLSHSPADMDFAGLKAAAAREIALSFGVPPMLAGLPGDATYANYREANKALWRQTILPLLSRILAALEQGLRPWFPELLLKIEEERIGALSEDRERLWAQIGAADFLERDEKRAMLGIMADDEDVEQEAGNEREISG